MSAYYDLYQTPDPLGENRNEPRLHARILPRGTISADKFRELVAKATGFSPAILDGTLQAVTDELYSWLSEGWTVEVGELGYFSVSLKCDRQVTDKKEIRSPSVHFQNVNLRLGSKFQAAAGRALARAGYAVSGANSVTVSIRWSWNAKRHRTYPVP